MIPQDTCHDVFHCFNAPYFTDTQTKLFSDVQTLRERAISLMNIYKHTSQTELYK